MTWHFPISQTTSTNNGAEVTPKERAFVHVSVFNWLGSIRAMTNTFTWSWKIEKGIFVTPMAFS